MTVPLITTKRSRVRGDGLDRRQMPLFAHLGTLPVGAVDEVLAVASADQSNAIAEHDQYSAASHIVHRIERTEGYRQVLFQEPVSADVAESEFGYRQWNQYGDLTACRWISEHFPTAARTRIAVLPAGGALNWHIDTNTSVACRVHIPLLNPAVPLLIRHGERTVASPWDIGECWFANTGWLHGVFNQTASPRINIIFSCHSDDVMRLIGVQDP